MHGPWGGGLWPIYVPIDLRSVGSNDGLIFSRRSVAVSLGCVVLLLASRLEASLAHYGSLPHEELFHAEVSLLCELCALHPPFIANTMPALVMRICGDDSLEACLQYLVDHPDDDGGAADSAGRDRGGGGASSGGRRRTFGARGCREAARGGGDNRNESISIPWEGKSPKCMPLCPCPTHTHAIIHPSVAPRLSDGVAANYE
mgnify:CR=1 FL=1